jgi:prepilin-type N-terminal cleavage/methylation domain-containing protein
VHDVPREGGFSMMELLVAVAVFTIAAAILFHFAARSQRLAASQPEAADVHQRLRVAVSTMQKDLINSGAGPLHGTAAGTLANYFPPIVPARRGARSTDPEIAVFADRISLVFVPVEGWSAALSSDMSTPDVSVALKTGLGCLGSGVCGFLPGMRAAIFDARAPGEGYELFSVTDIGAGLGHGAPNPPFTRAYAAASAMVVPVVHHVYYRDAATNRLMLYDGFQSDVPLLDNVVGLQFTYFADPSPSSVAPPSSLTASCLYTAGVPPTPLLQPLPGLTLVPLTTTQLRDGPFCGLAPARFDADLLRIRRVRVTIRMQAAAEHLRGSSANFVNPGSASVGGEDVKDYEMTFDVAPRNMSPTR